MTSFLLTQVQTPDPATGYHVTREERQFSEDGATMTLRLVIPAKPEIKCSRFYRRVVAQEPAKETGEEQEDVARW